MLVLIESLYFVKSKTYEHGLVVYQTTPVLQTYIYK